MRFYNWSLLSNYTSRNRNCDGQPFNLGKIVRQHVRLKWSECLEWSWRSEIRRLQLIEWSSTPFVSIEELNPSSSIVSWPEVNLSVWSASFYLHFSYFISGSALPYKRGNLVISVDSYLWFECLFEFEYNIYYIIECILLYLYWAIVSNWRPFDLWIRKVYFKPYINCV